MVPDNRPSDTPELIGWVGPVFTEHLPPHLRLLLLTDGKRISSVLHVVTTLGVADELARGPRTVPELAASLNCDEQALHRVLRVAAGFGVFTETAEGGFAQTELSEYLRRDNPDSQRDLVLYNGHDLVWQSYGELLYTVKTGKPAFDKLLGHSFFDHLEQDPETGRLFDRAMNQMSRATGQLLADAHDFSQYATIADVGGGSGYFLAELLRANPAGTGILVDLPLVVDQAGPVFTTAGVRERVRLCAADFFADPIPEADAYVLKAVLHDWRDEDALRILRQVRLAMSDRPQARLLIGEFLVGPANQWDRGRLLDMDMLLRFGGLERDLVQWRALLHRAGLRIVNDPAPGRWAVLECAIG